MLCCCNSTKYNNLISRNTNITVALDISFVKNVSFYYLNTKNPQNDIIFIYILVNTCPRYLFKYFTNVNKCLNRFMACRCLIMYEMEQWLLHSVRLAISLFCNFLRLCETF